MAVDQPTLIVIGGPTASGKTKYAIELAQFFKTEIISADSRQVYKEISIGTAKPSPTELSIINHHFIDHCSIHDTFNAGIFEKQALAVLETLFITHPVVIVTGGTGLYINALCYGLDDLPEANEAIRINLQNELNDHGLPWLFDKLERLDPQGSTTIDPKNPQRIMRALELVITSGKSLDQLKTKSIASRPFHIVKVMMNVERELLYQRINERVDNMISDGLVEEAKKVYPYKYLKSLNTVGYAELFDYFDAKLTLKEAIEKIKQHTRNYAKRQLTWFRNEEDWVMKEAFDCERYRSL